MKGMYKIYDKEKNQWIDLPLFFKGDKGESASVIPGEGEGSSVSGSMTEATGECSWAEGMYSIASAQAAHAEGIETTAIGDASHAEGCMTEASGNASHAEGRDTKATGNYSHASGLGTIASGEAEFACGKYNSPGKLFSVGNGFSDNDRENIFEITKDGTIYFNLDGARVSLQGILTLLLKNNGIDQIAFSNVITEE